MRDERQALQDQLHSGKRENDDLRQNLEGLVAKVDEVEAARTALELQVENHKGQFREKLDAVNEALRCKFPTTSCCLHFLVHA